MDEVDEAALRQARERLADDAHVAALLAAGDPAAERAALALAINAGSWSRALVGLSQPSSTWSGTSPAGCCDDPEGTPP